MAKKLTAEARELERRNTVQVYAGAAGTQQRLHCKLSGSTVFLYTSARGRPCVLAWRGAAIKPSANYSFATTERRARWAAEFLRGTADQAKRRAEQDAERRAKLATPHGLKLGDVLMNSWGYDQTNIDYYEVTKLVGGRTIEIRKIGAHSEASGDMQGYCVPAVGQYIGEPMRKRVDERDAVKIHSWGSWAHKLEPKVIAGAKFYRVDHWTAYH
jgi:hypothetical protein